MNKRTIRQHICAMLLGEGSLGRDGNLIFEHGIAQEDYASWKADLLDNVFIEKKLSRRCSRRLTTHKANGKSYQGYRVELYWEDYIGKFLEKRAYQYKNGKKQKNIEYLLSQICSDLHLSIWFMDDGGEMNTGVLESGRVKQPWYGLFTYGFTEGQVNLAIEWFKQHYMMLPQKTYFKPTDSYYLRFNQEYAEEIFNSCRSYFEQIPSMRKKFKNSFLTYGEGSETIGVTLAGTQDEDIVQVNT